MTDWNANVSRIYLFKFLVGMHFFAGVLIPFFTDWGGISFAQVMLLQSWFVLCMSVLEAPTGAVADRFGRKVSMLCGAASLIVAVLVYISKPDFKVFLLAETFWALSGAFISGADDALLYDSLKAAGQEHRSKTALSRLASCELTAILFGAPLGSLIAQHWGLKAPLMCMTLPFTAAFFVGLTLKEPPDGTQTRTGYWKTLSEGLSYATRHRVLRILAFDGITIFCFCFMLIWLFQPFLKTLGTPIAWFGVVVALCTGSQVIILSSVEKLERLCGGARRYLGWSAVLPGLSFLGLTLAGHPAAAIPLIVMTVAFGLSRWTIISNYMHKHIDSTRRATVISSISMARQIFSAVLYPLVGALEEWSLRGTFIVLGCAVLASAWLSQVEESHLLQT